VSPETRRIVLASILSVGLLMAWNFLFPQQRTPRPAPPATQTAAPAAPAPGPPASAPPGGPGGTAPSTPSAPGPMADAKEELVTLDGDGFDAVLTTHGGALKSFVLEGNKFKREVKGSEAQPIDLVRIAPGQAYPLALLASPELGGPAELAGAAEARAPMRIVSQGRGTVTFEGRAGQLTVRKVYRVTGKPFELSLDVELSGQPAAVSNGALSLLVPGFMPPDAPTGGMFSGPPLDFVRPVCRAGEDTERFDLTGTKAPPEVPGAVAWVGVDQHYFIAAVLPKEPLGSCVFARGPGPGSGLAALRVPIDGGTRVVSLTVYAGPKDLDHLRDYGRSFETAIDYGAMARPFAFFARMLLYVMRWLEKFVGNWGVAIILLTLLVKLLLLPLTYKSMQSMNEMRKLQPEIEKLKAKHGSDREKMNVAQMELFRQHKVNPLGGCLPMLLQLPIWFALYATLQTSVELYRAPFLWNTDLTQYDRFFILPVAMGISQFIMQKISPQPADNAQAKMMLYFMPVMFSAMMLFLPSGLTLYIFVNNLLSIGQQQAMLKLVPSPVLAKAK
jgi:YidC/Oxa1 family membrane protein insertase